MNDTSLHGILVMVALGTTLFIAVLGCLLAYHWIRYAMSRFATLIAIVTYCAVASMLLSILLSAAYAL